METKIYMLRHVQAMGNVRRVFQGHTDEPVSPLGEQQLHGISEYFKDIAIDKVYASPLIRTRRTAEATAKYHDLPVIAEQGLIEIYAGEFENRPWTELTEQYPEEMSHWGPDYHRFCARGGEPFLAVYERAVDTVMRLIAQNKGKTLVMATHGGFMRAFMTYVHDRDPEKMSVRDWHKNASVTLLSYDDKTDAFTVVLEDYRDFLPPELRN
ncbi:MAG: histidine phosphatase family protein [Clostridiales bacterium]|nr:histidine phosphatase family protein [Clostridiales bacterium]